MVAPSRETLISRVLHADSPDMNLDAAREVLGWQFTQADRDRVQELVLKNTEGTLTREERDEFHRYVILEEFMSVLHARAKLALAHAGQLAK